MKNNSSYHGDGNLRLTGNENRTSRHTQKFGLFLQLHGSHLLQCVHIRKSDCIIPICYSTCCGNVNVNGISEAIHIQCGWETG